MEGEFKGTPVDGDKELSFKIPVRLESPFRAKMNVWPAWVGGPYFQECEVKGAVLLSDIFKEAGVSRISPKVDTPMGAFEDIRAPKGSVPSLQGAAAEVCCGGGRNSDPSDLGGVSPVELDNFGLRNSPGEKIWCQSEGNDKEGVRAVRVLMLALSR